MPTGVCVDSSTCNATWTPSVIATHRPVSYTHLDVYKRQPRLMTALVEEAVSIGDLVRVFEFRQAKSAMVEMTLPPTSPYAGARVGDIPWPEDTVLVGIIREGRPIAPSRDDALEPQDELLFIAARTMEDNLENLLSPGHLPRGKDEDLSLIHISPMPMMPNMKA